jgi:Asp-tRNA(Asn)/Glu-tRNA(Gln) amidotransferase A subunit family amidase
MDDELVSAPATELGRRISSRELSPVELTDAVLERVDDLNGILCAFVTVTDDVACAGARAAAQRAANGALLGPLDGIPFSIKDLELTAGIRTTFGSRFTADHVPATDSLTAARLRASGGVLLGKTNTPQLGYKDACDNMVAATPVNPWDATRSPGGAGFRRGGVDTDPRLPLRRGRAQAVHRSGPGLPERRPLGRSDPQRPVDPDSR